MQTSFSHSSTESEIISLYAGLRLDGIPALDLWDLIVSVFGNTTQNHDRSGQPVVNCDMKTVHMEYGTLLLKGCWLNSQKADVQFSALRAHCPEVNSKAKDMEHVDSLCSRFEND